MIRTGAEHAREIGGYFNEPDCKDLDHIPGSTGLPVLGSVVDFAQNLNQFLADRVDKYGLVSRLKLPDFDGVLVLHPDDLQRVYMDKDKDFSSYMGYKKSVGNFYDGSIIMRDFDDHRIQRRMFQNAFKNKALKDYIDIINPTVKANVDTWQAGDRFLFMDGVRDILMDIACRVFVGLDECRGEEAQKLNQAFYDVNHKGLLAVIKKDLPFTNFAKGKRGQEYLESYFRKLIPIRRENPGRDLMSLLVQEKDEDGNYWSDDILLPHLTLLLFAAHDTTTGTIGHTMMYLAKPENLHWQEKLREQAMAKGTDFLAYEDLEDMTDFQNCLQEALRLHPVLTLAPRRTTREITMRGVRIPANTQIFAMSHWAHRSEEYWSDPETFDPNRFNEPRKEHKSHAYAFTPFGGGAHKCLGMHFAIVNGKIILHQLLRKYRFELADGYDCRCESIPIPGPSKRLPLKITPINQ